MPGTKKWTDAEIATLRFLWSGDQPVRMWVDQLPDRNESAIFNKALRLGLPHRSDHLARPVALGWRLVQQVLLDGIPRTAEEISAVTRLSRWAVTTQLKRHSEIDVHVVSHKPGRHKAKVWKIGPGKNAKRPAPKPHNLCVQEWRRRALKTKPELFEAINARRRVRHAEKKGKLVRRDVAASWI